MIDSGYSASDSSGGARARTVLDLIARQLRGAPDALAVADASERVSYAALGARSAALARRLRSLGVGADVLVAIVLERSVAFVIATLGALRAGGAYLPIDPEYPVDRIGFMLADARPRAVITTARLADRLPRGPWDTMLVDRQAHDVSDAAGQLALPSVDHLAYVIYTSGSTGRPKGVEITHRNLLNLVGWHVDAFAIEATDRGTQFASPGFDAAVWEIWPYLAAGASLHVPDDATRVDVDRLRDWLVSERITVSFVPTPLAERLIALEWPSDTAVRMLLTGADTLHRYPAPGLPFTLVNNYGPTECTVVATSGIVSPGAFPSRLPSVGRSITNVRIYILDAERRPVPIGAPGEIYIGGAGVGRGYLNLPELTAERFVPDPFDGIPGARLYRTGDLGRWLPGAEIAFEGRVDDQIKVRGFRIEPDEIVAALDADPSVEASAVVARDDEAGERRLVAYLVARPDGPKPTIEALRASLAASLPEYMIPSVFVVLPELPLTANGKVDRAALPEPDDMNTLRAEEFVAPRTAIEEQLASMLAELLGLDRVSVTENFFLLGGHSLLGAQLLARVREAFGVEPSLRTLFTSATVAALGAEIEREILAKHESADRGGAAG